MKLSHFEVKRKVITIGAIEMEVWKALEKFKGKKVLLEVSKKIGSLMKINIGYDEEGFGIYEIKIDKDLKEEEFILTELNSEVTAE